MSGNGVVQMRLSPTAMMDVVQKGLQEQYFSYLNKTPRPIDVTRNNDGEFIIKFEEEDDPE